MGDKNSFLVLWLEIYENNNYNILTPLMGLEDSPGDQEILSWWGGAGDIYFVFHAVDNLIGNL